jgi:tetratricopeptide (TPR) repeat protein
MTNLAKAQSLFFSALHAHEKGDLNTAELLYREALLLAPGRSSVVKNLSAVLFELQKWDCACDLCSLHLESYPADILVRTQLGNTQLGMGLFENALENYAAVLGYAPDQSEALINMAYAMESLGRLPEALSNLNHLIELTPDHAAALVNRGNVLTKLNRFEDALRDYQRAQRIEPTSPMSYWNESVCRLFSGDLEGGWKLYGWGWQAGQRGGKKPEFTQPTWNGTDHVNTLLVWGEQGIGDQILFSGMLNDLRSRVKNIVVAIEKRLVPLFRRSFPDFDVTDIDTATTLDKVDQQIAVGDLGLHFRKNWQAFTNQGKRILVPDQARLKALRQRLSDGKHLICGFSWSSTNPKIGRFKSLAEADLSVLGAIQGVRWVDLQYGDTREQRSRFMERFGLNITHFDDIDNFNDIDGLAALTGACDLVVTVSNTTAHLAGALGVPTKVMLPHDIGRLWYWHYDKATSPWYPPCSLIRQSIAGDWTPVIASISFQIEEQAKTFRQ